MLHILNTLEREFSKKFTNALSFGIESLDNEYFMRLLNVYDEREVDYRDAIDFENHNLKHEEKMFRFFEEIFKLNNNCVFVGDFKINKIENMKILYMLRDLDYTDSIKLINILRSHLVEEDAYKVTDFGVFKMLLTLFTREVHFPKFYFNKLDIMVFPHYDLSTVMYFRDENYINTYIQFAKVNGLILSEREKRVETKYLSEVF